MYCKTIKGRVDHMYKITKDHHIRHSLLRSPHWLIAIYYYITMQLNRAVCINVYIAYRVSKIKKRSDSCHLTWEFNLRSVITKISLLRRAFSKRQNIYILSYSRYVCVCVCVYVCVCVRLCMCVCDEKLHFLLLCIFLCIFFIYKLLQTLHTWSCVCVCC